MLSSPEDVVSPETDQIIDFCRDRYSNTIEGVAIPTAENAPPEGWIRIGMNWAQSWVALAGALMLSGLGDGLRFRCLGCRLLLLAAVVRNGCCVR